MKKQTGITLIALVITIIVLLILAGVTIATLTGDSGLLTKATDAKKANESANIEEQIKLAYIEYKTSNSLNNEYTFKQAIDNANIDYEKFEENDDEYDITVLLQNQTEKFYVISKDGNLNAYTITWKKLEDGTITDGNVILNVGDYINYESTLEEITLNNNSQIMKDIYQYLGSTGNNSIVQERNLKWRVLDVKYGQLLLISETPTESKLRCYGSAGYNNSVFFINELCKELYSSDKGISRNLNIEDVEKQLVYNYKGYTVSNIKYDEIKEYNTDRLSFPSIYLYEKGLKKIDDKVNNGKLSLSQQSKNDITTIAKNETAKNSLQVTQTFWKKEMIEEDFSNEKYYELFINNGSNYSEYWLASRAVSCTYSQCPSFCIRTISNGSISGYTAVYVYGSNNNQCNYLRPVVTLNDYVRIQKDEMHDGSQEKACLIK